MTLAFDLISDLHVESWDSFDWSGQATSPICVIAGDIARDPTRFRDTVEHISKNYQVTMVIDGNEEHKYNWDGLTSNTDDMQELLKDIPKVVYLHNNVVILNGVAFLGTNGWWSWDFDPSIDESQCFSWFCSSYHCNSTVPHLIKGLSRMEVQYLTNSIAQLQTHPEVKRIVIVTHTVPAVDLIEHDASLSGSYRINGMGTSMRSALEADTQNKVRHWCMGHYHGSIDQIWDGVRYVNNPRGRGDTVWRQVAYYPKRIEVSF